MMNFSDETVSKLVGAVQKARYMASCDIVSGNVAATSKEIDSRIVTTILSSLTLADLMQVEEVRELVEALQEIKVPHEMINRALTGIERASKFSNDAVISNTAFIRGFQKQIGCILSDAEKRIIQPEGEK